MLEFYLVLAYYVFFVLDGVVPVLHLVFKLKHSILSWVYAVVRLSMEIFI